LKIVQSETITLLRAKRGRACKTITPYGTRSYDHIKHWSYGSATVASLADFATLLTKLETDEETIIIRGRPRHRLAAAEIVLRRKAMFESQPLRLVCFDIDQLEAPEGVSPISEAAIEHVIRLLPSAFHTANYVAQFSASAGLTARAVKVHLWFMLRTPAEDDALRAWARSTGVVDPALFNAIQPHYVANPRFEEGALDPFDGGSRVHYMRKQHECVDWAPPPVTAAVRPAGGECVASEIVTDDGGKAIDGRETRLRNIRWRVLNDAKRPRTLEEFTARVWQEFCERAVLGYCEILT
jgi:hypothetical protein